MRSLPDQTIPSCKVRHRCISHAGGVLSKDLIDNVRDSMVGKNTIDNVCTWCDKGFKEQAVSAIHQRICTDRPEAAGARSDALTRLH
jgi:hypothetical protein